MYVFGLGNPGKKYEKTKHNVGFDVVSLISERFVVDVNLKKFRSFCGKGMLEGKKIMLFKPQTYMNESGKSVLSAMAFYKFPVEKVVVVYDDFSLPLGKIRVRKKGSAGGHNGIKSIIGSVGENFIRVRVGIGSPDKNVTNFVLSSFSKKEKQIIEEVYHVAVDCVKSIVVDGVDFAMNKYNSYSHDSVGD